MGKFESNFVNFALAGLLIVAMIFFIITLQQDNNASELLTDNTLINESFGELQENLGGMRDQAQIQRTIFEEENPKTGFPGSLILFSIVSSGKVFTGMVFGIFNVIIKLPMVLFGINPIVASVISTILIVVFILSLWVLYKLGG